MVFDKKQWRKDNKEAILEYQRQWRKDNPEAWKNQCLKNYENNKEYYKEYHKEYYKNNIIAEKKRQSEYRHKMSKKIKDLFPDHCACIDGTCDGKLEFHHKNPATKRFNLSACGVANLTPIWLYEISKCVLVCQKHHDDLQAKILNYRKRIYLK